MLKIIHKGRAGHFIGSTDCLFHLHTQLLDESGNGYRVSTIGLYMPNNFKDYQMLDLHNYYKTVVFVMSDYKVQDWTEVDYVGVNDYPSPESDEKAETLHQEMINKYANIGD
jgi:hypothetical protein